MLFRPDPEAPPEGLGNVLFDGGDACRGMISGPVERMKSAISLVVSFLALASRGSILLFLPFAEVCPLPDIRPLIDADGVRNFCVVGLDVWPWLDNEPSRFELTGGGLERRPFIPFNETTERPVIGRVPGSALSGSLPR